MVLVMFIINMSLIKQSLNVSGRHKFHSSEISVLKVCVKFNPPSLGLYYTAASSPDKKFLHSIEVTKEIQANLSSTAIYNQILEREPGYWNNKKVPKAQIIHLIEKLLSSKDKSSFTSKNVEELCKSQGIAIKGYESLRSIDSSNYEEPTPAADFVHSETKQASIKEISLSLNTQKETKAPELSSKYLLHDETKKYKEDESEEIIGDSDVQRICQELLQSNIHSHIRSQ